VVTALSWLGIQLGSLQKGFLKLVRRFHQKTLVKTMAKQTKMQLARHTIGSITNRFFKIGEALSPEKFGQKQWQKRRNYCLANCPLLMQLLPMANNIQSSLLPKCFWNW